MRGPHTPHKREDPTFRFEGPSEGDSRIHGLQDPYVDILSTIYSIPYITSMIYTIYCLPNTLYHILSTMLFRAL